MNIVVAQQHPQLSSPSQKTKSIKFIQTTKSIKLSNSNEIINSRIEVAKTKSKYFIETIQNFNDLFCILILCVCATRINSETYREILLRTYSI